MVRMVSTMVSTIQGKPVEKGIFIRKKDLDKTLSGRKTWRRAKKRMERTMGVSYRVLPQGPSIEGKSPSLRALGISHCPQTRWHPHHYPCMVEVEHGHGALWLSSNLFFICYKSSQVNELFGAGSAWLNRLHYTDHLGQ